MYASWFMVMRRGEYTRRFRTLSQTMKVANYLWDGREDVEVRGLDERTGYTVTIWRNGKWAKGRDD